MTRGCCGARCRRSIPWRTRPPVWALDVRTKELIALAIAVSKECDGCIAAHAHAAMRHGATPQEAAEAIGVTFLMNGGLG